MTQISVTRALVDLKRLSDKINRAVLNGKFVSKTVGKNNYRKVVGTNMSVEEMTRTIQGSFDSVESLYDQRIKIKSAIVLSNANTMITLGGKVMSVAEAIELKTAIAFKQDYLTKLRQQLAVEMNEVTKTNVALDTLIETSINNIYGADKGKVTADIYQTVAAPQKEQKEAALLDPCKIEDKIKALEEEISLVVSELDFTLSEANARTMIEV